MKGLLEFQVRLIDGRIFNVNAWTKADIPTKLEELGISRTLIGKVRKLGTLLDAIMGT